MTTLSRPGIYIIGDSISLQYGPYLEEYLKGKIAYSRKEGREEAMLDLDRPAGANGGDSGMVLDFLQQMKAQDGIQADILVVNCGLHDIKVEAATGIRQVSIENYAGNLEAILQLADEMGKPFIWIRTTPCDEKVHNREGMEIHRFAADCDAYNAVADQIMTQHRIPMIDLHNFTLELGEDLYCDHVHFHEHIREKQAQLIADWLLDHLGR